MDSEESINSFEISERISYVIIHCTIFFFYLIGNYFSALLLCDHSSIIVVSYSSIAIPC